MAANPPRNYAEFLDQLWDIVKLARKSSLDRYVEPYTRTNILFIHFSSIQYLSHAKCFLPSSSSSASASATNPPAGSRDKTTGKKPRASSPPSAICPLLTLTSSWSSPKCTSSSPTKRSSLTAPVSKISCAKCGLLRETATVLSFPSALWCVSR